MWLRREVCWIALLFAPMSASPLAQQGRPRPAELSSELASLDLQALMRVEITSV
jgi:hypothetical protein